MRKTLPLTANNELAASGSPLGALKHVLSPKRTFEHKYSVAQYVQLKLTQRRTVVYKYRSSDLLNAELRGNRENYVSSYESQDGRTSVLPDHDGALRNPAILQVQRLGERDA